MPRAWLIALLVALAPAAAAAGETCRYRVEALDAAADMLAIEARCADPGTRFAGARDFRDAFVRAREPLEAGGVRYRFALGELAAAARDPDVALRVGRSVVATWSAFLLTPEADAELAIETIGPLASALPRADGLSRLAAREAPYAGYVILGQFESRTFAAPNAGDAVVEAALADVETALSVDELAAWARDSVGAVADYLGGFGARRTLIVMIPVPGRGGVAFGRVTAGGGPSLMLRIGAAATRAQLYGEWVLVHELLHAGTPFVRGGGWFMEGLATFAEPLLRARAGWLAPEDVWAEWTRDMPRGVDGARLNLRQRYWGGALFFLQAEIALRKRSNGAVGLEACLRAMTQAGANASLRWTLPETLRFCDEATGTDVFTSLAAAMPAPDLEALWRELGVARAGGAVRFDDSAPLAAARRAITTRAP